jgi:hypothetical protein
VRVETAGVSIQACFDHAAVVSDARVVDEIPSAL